MPETELKISFPDAKLDALRYFTEKEGVTIEDELRSHLEKVYQKNVPLQVRNYIENRAGLRGEPAESNSSASEQQGHQQRQSRRRTHTQPVQEAPDTPQPEQENQGMTMGGL
ncbi:hypothetical protein A7X67_00115 [Clostridium sp. W14A]|nr:hypothetical protein A7X67_00115 [Clostridium sp. W14A]